MPPYGQQDPYSQNPYGQQSPYGKQPDPYALPPANPPQSGPPYPPTYQMPVSGVPHAGYPAPISGVPQTAYQPGYGPQPGGMPAGMFGYEPETGLPYSDKSKTVAGLLQLLLGFFGLGGIGRIYAGSMTIGITQLVLSFVGYIGVACLWILIVPFFFFAGLWLWFIIDGIMMLVGRPVDGQGRPLRS